MWTVDYREARLGPRRKVRILKQWSRQKWMLTRHKIMAMDGKNWRGLRNIQEMEPTGLEHGSQGELDTERKVRNDFHIPCLCEVNDWCSPSPREEIQEKTWREGMVRLGGWEMVRILSDTHVEVYNKQLGIWSKSSGFEGAGMKIWSNGYLLVFMIAFVFNSTT